MASPGGATCPGSIELLLGVRWARVCSLPCRGDRAEQRGKEAWLRPFAFLRSKVWFLPYFRFLLNILVGRVWMAACGTGCRAALGSFGQLWWPVSSSQACPLTVPQLQVPSLVGDGSALEDRSNMECLEHKPTFSRPWLPGSSKVPIDCH